MLESHCLIIIKLIEYGEVTLEVLKALRAVTYIEGLFDHITSAKILTHLCTNIRRQIIYAISAGSL